MLFILRVITCLEHFIVELHEVEQMYDKAVCDLLAILLVQSLEITAASKALSYRLTNK